MLTKQYYVYIITNKLNKVLYTGVTNNLCSRVSQHKSGIIDGFSKRYKLNKLIYFENTDDIKSAIEREKQIKGWLREKKIKLIENFNPQWNDLYEEYCQ
ncbi:MAG TPA: GIY-YIG nuclease family protein [Ignavibacteria bacterium]|nr:GIY-YIG nuclease family protein [Ignavibacteria bacterium]